MNKQPRNKQEPRKPKDRKSKQQAPPRKQNRPKSAHANTHASAKKLSNQLASIQNQMAQLSQKRQDTRSRSSRPLGRMNRRLPYGPMSTEAVMSRPISHQRQSVGHHRRSAVISVQDEMYAAKMLPGEFAPKYFSVGGEITPLKCSVVKKEAAVGKCWDTQTQSYAPLGLRRYTLIAYCAPLSEFYSNYQARDYKLGGMLMVQTDNVDERIFHVSMFTDTQSSLTLTDLYQDDGSGMSANGMIFASRATFSLLGPELARAGTISYGMIPMASAVDNENEMLFTLNEMQASTYLKQDCKDPGGCTVDLFSSLVNNQVPANWGMNFNPTSYGNSSFGLEYISWALIQMPFQSVNDGTPVQFTMDRYIQSTYVYSERPRSAFVKWLSTKPAPIKTHHAQTESVNLPMNPAIQKVNHHHLSPGKEPDQGFFSRMTNDLFDGAKSFMTWENAINAGEFIGGLLLSDEPRASRSNEILRLRDAKQSMSRCKGLPGLDEVEAQLAYYLACDDDTYVDYYSQPTDNESYVEQSDDDSNDDDKKTSKSKVDSLSTAPQQRKVKTAK